MKIQDLSLQSCQSGPASRWAAFQLMMDRIIVFVMSEMAAGLIISNPWMEGFCRINHCGQSFDFAEDLRRKSVQYTPDKPEGKEIGCMYPFFFPSPFSSGSIAWKGHVHEFDTT